MKNSTQAPTLKKIVQARDDFRNIYDENLRIKKSGKNIYDKGLIDKLNKELEEIGISQDLTPKEQEITLEKWFELLSNPQTTITEVPRPEGLNNTTLTSDQITNFDKDVERIKESEKIRSDQKVETARFEKRNKEIYAEQQRIQAAIKNKGVIVVPVTELPKATLNDNDRQTIVTFSNTAREDPYTLEQFIESKIKESLATATEEYKENITPSIITKSATSITENFAALTYENISEVPNEVTIMNPSSPFIPLTTYDNEKLKEIIPDEEVRIRFSEKTQSLAVGINAKANMDFSATKTLFGENIASVFYGPVDGHITQFEIAKNQEEQKDEGIQFSLEDIYKTGEKFYNFYQKVKTAKTVEEVTSSAIIYTPTYTRATSAVVAAKTASTLAKALPYVGAYSGLRLTAPLLMNPNIAGYLGTGATQQMVILSSPVVSRNAFMFVSKGGKTALAIGTEKTVAGKTIFRVGVKFGQSSIATATTTAGTQVVTATGFFAKVVTFLGGLSTPVTAGIGLVVGYLAGKVIEKLPQIKKWFQENGPVLAGVAGLGGLALGGPAVGGLVLFGGLAAAGSLTAFATGAFGVLGLIGRSVGIAIATPVIVTLLVLPPLVAFIMLVINNSAYLVPPSPYSSSQNGGVDNPYMLVTKNANPTKLDNSNSNQTVIYVVTVKALKGNLTNVNITGSECNVIKKDKSTIKCPTEVFPDITNDSISPNEPHTFSFTGIYDSKYSDSLISDSITFTATAEDGTEVTTSGSASVCIGECPANCAVVSDNADDWPPSARAKAQSGIGILSQYQGFTAKACPNNEPINLCYKPSEIDPDLYAWHVHNKDGNDCDVYFNGGPFDSRRDDGDAAFIITHEITHHIQRINGGPFVGYVASGSYWELKGNGLCTYSSTAGGPLDIEAQQEAMAESAALFVDSSPTWDTCATNYKGLYPKSYLWSQDFMTK